MKLRHLKKVTESDGLKKYLYHVTFTKNIPNIKKKGLVQFQPSNWIKGPGGDRYNNDTAGIFAFDHPEDALNWAGKMEWEFRDTDKDMSIVRIDMEDFWEDDPAEDPFVSNKGKARYSNRNIKADKIIDVLDMSGIKKPGDLGISRDEWLADVSKKLKEMHGGGGIPDYTTMPAYGLKRARKGKNKFFVPKGEKLPAGVAAIKENKHNWKEIENRLSRHPGITGGIIGSQEAKNSVDAWIKVLKVGEEQMDFFDAELPKALPLVIRMMELEALKHPWMFGWFQDDDTIGQVGDLEPYEDLPGFIKTIANKIGIIEIPDDEANYFEAIKDAVENESMDQEAGIGHENDNFPDGINLKFKVEDLIKLSQNYPTKELNPTIFNKQIKNRIGGSKKSNDERAMKADLQWPIIVVDFGSGDLMIADGTHRAQKAILQKVKITAKIIPAEDMEQFKVPVDWPIKEAQDPKPIVYVDMDGVLVDFFGEWSNMHGVESWRDIAPLMKSQGKTIDDALDAIRARDDFWINLKPHTGANALLAAIKKYAGEYIILSSPLSNDPNSEPQKRAWVKNNLNAFLPKKVIIHKRKQDYATQKDGTPNILIDDFSNQIKPWKAAGGIAFKHSNTNTATTVNALKQQFESTTEEAWKVKVPTKNKRKMSKQDKDWSMLRTALESDLFEEGAGDCFHVAGRTMIDMTEEQEVYGMKMIHAYVYGQGELKGRRFPHAWVEQGDVVLDNSNGNSIVMRKEQYYPLGGIVEESGAYATYVKEDCLIKMLKHSHWGPWDLNDSLDEGIPNEVKEIGKKKSRIPRNLLNTIEDELDLETKVESAWERFKSNVA